MHTRTGLYPHRGLPRQPRAGTLTGCLEVVIYLHLHKAHPTSTTKKSLIACLEVVIGCLGTRIHPEYILTTPPPPCQLCAGGVVLPFRADAHRVEHRNGLLQVFQEHEGHQAPVYSCTRIMECPAGDIVVLQCDHGPSLRLCPSVLPRVWALLVPVRVMGVWEEGGKRVW